MGFEVKVLMGRSLEAKGEHIRTWEGDQRQKRSIFKVLDHG